MTRFWDLADRVLQGPGWLLRRMAGVALPPRPLREIAGERVRLAQVLAMGGPGLVTVLIVGQVLSAASPTVFAVAVGWLVGEILAGPDSLAPLSGPLVLFAAVLIAQQLAQLIEQTAGVVTANQIDRKVRRRVRELALAPATIGHLEEPGFHDEAVRASDRGLGAQGGGRVRSPGTAAIGQVVFVFRVVAAVSAAGLIAQLSWWLATWLLVASLWNRAIVRTQWIELAARNNRFTHENRKVGYWTDLAAGQSAAKEVRLFGLGDWITDRRTTTRRAILRATWRTKNLIYGRQIWIVTLAVCSAGPALLVPSLAVLDGGLGLDSLAMYITAAWAVFRISFMGYEAFDIEHGIGAVHALDRLAEDGEKRTPEKKKAGRPAWLPDRRAGTPPMIRFENVSFGYPTGDGHRVLDGLDLVIQPGEVLGIVGINGAGKTTMMKLLGGLYPPTTGRITIEGTDLAEVNVESWRRRVTVLFQDFVRYPLTAGQNVSLGGGQLDPDERVLADAVGAAEAAELLAGLPAGAGTLLSRTRSGGVDLSGGQWQRVALARTLYAVRRGRDVVVLDEPTAHLDVQAEADFYDQVVRAVSGATVVLISHRLSTIRPADRIVVLNGGRITETGHHDQLLDAGGEYARLFRLQAARFTDTADPATVG